MHPTCRDPIFELNGSGYTDRLRWDPLRNGNDANWSRESTNWREHGREDPRGRLSSTVRSVTSAWRQEGRV